MGAFCALVYFGDRVIADFLERIILESQTRFSTVYRGGRERSVLVLGNSRGVNAIYAPATQDIIGIPVLNLSYNGMSMELAEALLADYLDRNARPRLIVLEITNLGDRSDLVNDLRVYCKFSNRLEKVLEKEAPKSAIMGRMSRLYNLNGEIFLRSLYYFKRSDQMWINRYRIAPSLLENISRKPTEELQFISNNTKSLSRILQLMREKRIPTRLLISPYLPAYAERIPNLREWINRGQQLVGPDFQIWDYSNAIQEVPGFADRVHMNEYGSRLLLGCLVRDGFFSGI